MFFFSTLCVLAKTHIGPRGMLASAVWLSVGMGIRSLWRVTRPVVLLLLICHMDCVCQGVREQSISFVGLQDTNKMNSGVSAVEHEPLLINTQNILKRGQREREEKMLFYGSYRRGSHPHGFLILQAKNYAHETSAQAKRPFCNTKLCMSVILCLQITCYTMGYITLTSSSISWWQKDRVESSSVRSSWLS